MSTSESNPVTLPDLHSEPKWLAFDAYVFDIDGTLLNSRDLVHYRAFQGALKDVFQCERDITEVPVHGNTDIGILRATTQLSGVSEGRFNELLPEALRQMRKSVHETRDGFRAEVCPSIVAVLETLKARGKVLGVATGNLEAIGWRKLEAAQLKQYFNFGSFSDRHEHRSEIFLAAIEESRRRLGPHASVCFVGDTPNDIRAAKANQCPVIAVATGIYPFAELESLGPDFCLRCCDDLFTA